MKRQEMFDKVSACILEHPQMANKDMVRYVKERHAMSVRADYISRVRRALRSQGHHVPPLIDNTNMRGPKKARIKRQSATSVKQKELLASLVVELTEDPALIDVYKKAIAIAELLAEA